MAPPAAEPLENDPANPCVGCGPENPLGLRLAFAREGRGARTTLESRTEWQGWPGRLHSGILYTAMLETANWSVYAAKERVGLPVRTSALATKGWVPTGARLTLTGSIAREGPEGLTMVVRAVDEAGKEVASLERDFAFPGRKEFLARMGYDELPEVLAEVVPE